MKLVNGSLYLVQRDVRPSQPETVAMFRSDADSPERDEDEMPRHEWVFFGTEITMPLEQYKVLARLDVVPVRHDTPGIRTWGDDA